MKTLFLLRHAKTAPATAGALDFDRILTPQGETDSRLVGEYIERKQLKIDQVVSSPANRARGTTALVLEAAWLVVEVQYDRRMYEADPQLMLDIVSESASSHDSILLVGHNPAMEDFLRGLTGRVESLSAGGIAQIESEVTSWTELGPGKCELKLLLSPGDLGLAAS
ncbi:MAG TPA: histidine phosphatase family protein [Pyrinomonadaceae bacterium]|nr:histidine phosphatase family protein [Pyrinomonadaceae bacterium]